MSTTGLPPGIPLNNDDLGSQIIVASWTLTSVAALFLFTRVVAKIWTRRGLWLDDHILIVAWLAVLAPAITSTIAVNEGLGKHVYNVPVENAPRLSYLINTTVTVLILASALSKTSFVITVMRLVSGYMRWAAWFILVTTNVFFAINIVLLWESFDPNPMNTPVPTASALAMMRDLTDYGIFVTVYSATMDFALVGMAWGVVSRLRVRPRREKLGVGLAMSMGIIAGVTSIIKATIFPTIAKGDVTYTSASLHIWSIAEPSMTIIAASIPLLRILFTHARHLTTQKSGTHLALGKIGTGPSGGGSETKRTGPGLMRFSITRAGPYELPYANVDGFKSIEEIMMLEDLEEVARVQTGDSLEVPQVEKADDEGIELTRPASVLGSEEVYHRRLAKIYALGRATPEPGAAF